MSMDEDKARQLSDPVCLSRRFVLRSGRREHIYMYMYVHLHVFGLQSRILELKMGAWMKKWKLPLKTPSMVNMPSLA